MVGGGEGAGQEAAPGGAMERGKAEAGTGSLAEAEGAGVGRSKETAYWILSWKAAWGAAVLSRPYTTSHFGAGVVHPDFSAGICAVMRREDGQGFALGACVEKQRMEAKQSQLIYKSQFIKIRNVLSFWT